MRVHEQNLTPMSSTASRGAAETQRTGGTGNGSGAEAARSDRIELSGAASSISRALTADGAGRAARVRELASQYQSGRYQPDPAATSRAMVADALASTAV